MTAFSDICITVVCEAIIRRRVGQREEGYICYCSKWKNFITAWDAVPRVIRSLKVIITTVIVYYILYESKIDKYYTELHCHIVNVNITDFTGENYIRIGRNTHHYYNDWNFVFKVVTADY